MSELTVIGDRLLVIYDGRCGLCNRTVRWLLRCDLRDRLRFVAAESTLVSALLARHGFAQSNQAAGASTGTVLVVRDPDGPAEQVLVRSGAFLSILHELRAPWPAVAGVLSLIPRPIRDFGYRLIARWRYRLWGKLTSCPIPTAEERSHFL